MSMNNSLFYSEDFFKITKCTSKLMFSVLYWELVKHIGSERSKLWPISLYLNLDFIVWTLAGDWAILNLYFLFYKGWLK